MRHDRIKSSQHRSTAQFFRIAGRGLVCLLAATVLTISPALSDIQNLAFPGATGFGRNSAGWRGGDIVAVTTLSDSGPGSLRACAEDATRPRICVFEISGTIMVDRSIRVASNTYIAGQTAPGQGIQIKLGKAQNTPLVIVNVHDVLVRFLKLRPGNSTTLSANVDGITVEGSHNVYLDFLSVQFATDENVNVHVNGRPTRDITIARSIVAWGLDKANHPKGRHSKGALICSDEGPQHECGRISLIGNLFAHNRDRNPDIKATAVGPVEVINNVFYNPISQFGEFYNLIGETEINYIGNVALPGPNTRSLWRPAAVEAFAWNETFGLRIFADDNLNLDRPSCRLEREIAVIDRSAQPFLVAEPIQPIMHEAIPAAETLNHVLMTAGSRLPDARFHDQLDARLIADVRNCSGAVINAASEAGGWPDLPVEHGKPDADHDGMPDDWERTHGLLPDDASDAWMDRDGDGWSNIDEYLAVLAGDIGHEPR